MRFYTQPFVGLLLLLLLLLATFVSADERVLLLEDGSQIRGELISYAQGTYTMRTGSLGIVELSDQQVQQVTSVKSLAVKSKIRPNIRPEIEPSVARVEAENSANSISSASIEALQSAMMSSTSIMNGITSLQSDPQVQALLADPEVLRAIQSLDFDTLSTNPKIQALMKNPKVKALQAEIGMGQ